jgi:hypothetical protein
MAKASMTIKVFSAQGVQVEEIGIPGSGSPGPLAANALSSYKFRTGEQGTATVYKSGAFMGRFKLAPNGWQAKKI